MKNYLEMAKATREKVMNEKESLMISHKDDFLTQLAQWVGERGYCKLDFFTMSPYNGGRVCDKWFDHYTMSQSILAKWAEDAGFRVIRQWYGCSTEGEPDWLTFKF